LKVAQASRLGGWLILIEIPDENSHLNAVNRALAARFRPPPPIFISTNRINVFVDF